MISFLNLLETEEDKEKFERLYNTYSSFLYRVAMKKLNCREDSEECVQETFFYIAKNFGKIGEIESNSTRCYLATIASGYAINKFKKSKRIEFISIDELKRTDYTEDLKYFEKYNAIELSLLINKLEEETKVYFYLTYYFGYTSTEIAKMYNVKDYFVRRKLMLARNNLRDMLERGK